MNNNKRPSIKTPVRDILNHTYVNPPENFTCFIGCGAIMNINTPKILQRGHIVAHANGGADSVNNLRIVCRSCNLKQLTEHMFDYMKKYGFRPPVICEEFNNHQCHQLPIKRFDARKIRFDCLENCEKYFKKYGKLHGIISAPTGVGKTLMALEAVGKIIRPGGVVLWLTERKDIIGTQFTPANIMYWKANNIIPADCAILFKEHLKYCDRFPRVCIISSTIDTAMSGCFRKLLNVENLGVVIDETHMAEGDKTYEMIKELLPKAKIMLGLSATHKFDERMIKMYGSGDATQKPQIYSENVFLEYSYLEALHDCVIRPVDFKISRATRIATTDADACLFDRISDESKVMIFKNVLDICNRTVKRKGIIWCGGIKSAIKWYEYFKNNNIDQNLVFVIDHSKLPSKRASKSFEDFCEAKGNTIMIVAKKHSQGVDIQDLDFGAIIDYNPARDIRVFLQMVGRLTRAVETSRGNAIFCEFIVSESEIEYTKNIKSMIENYYFSICEKNYTISDVDCGRIEYLRNGGTTGMRIKHKNTDISFEILDGITDIDVFEKDEKFIANLLFRTGKSTIDYEQLKGFLRTAEIKEPAVAEMLFRKLYDEYNDINNDEDTLKQTIEVNVKVGEFTAIIKVQKRIIKDINNWWGIVRYIGINFNNLLGIDCEKYYKTLEEAKNAIRVAENNLNINDVKGKTDRDIYDILRKFDEHLHINPVGYYSVNNFTEYYSPNRRKWIKK